MIILIAGASHTGKTALAQTLLEKLKYPYFCLDHLKMGLIRSGNTELTPESDDGLLTEYLWNIVKEMIKTAIENEQNLIVEGCYIPFDYAKDFEPEYLDKIRYLCLVMSENYITTHFSEIMEYNSVVENRKEFDDCTMEMLLRDNKKNLVLCGKYNVNSFLIEERYESEKIIKRMTRLISA